MAKAADSFRITAEVGSEALGPVLAQLARMGLQNVSHELVADMPAPPRVTSPRKVRSPPEKRSRMDGPRVKKEVTNYDFMVNGMKGRRRITSEELRQLFVEDGRNPKSVGPMISRMRKRKIIRDVASGDYAILKKIK